ncbi:uncharacterized protein Dana_GF28091 [Drosophila ananassae]|uniref:Uncharacterized protein n=1 Tax=Drosophila ananassae TaxID=7217 RepID=A0A0P8ZLE9_DROAN|nr:uncharacterized protein Dana_GF28091 [Drosophila ananassae]
MPLNPRYLQKQQISPRSHRGDKEIGPHGPNSSYDGKDFDSCLCGKMEPHGATTWSSSSRMTGYPHRRLYLT